MRRLVALALGAFMLHLNAQRADIACAQHGGNGSSSTQESQSATHSMHGAAMHEVATTAGQAAASETEGCETPVQPACCQALVSCSIALGLDARHQSADPAAIHEAIVLAGQTRPASRVAEPEPPPPKA